MGKKLSLLALSGLFCLYACSQQYIRLEGTIGKYPIDMHLHQLANGEYIGFYNYKSAAQPVYLAGADSVKGGNKQIHLYGMIPGDTAAERFVLKRNGTDYSGSWESGRKGVAGLPVKTLVRKQEMFATQMIHTAKEEPLHKGKENSPRASYEVFAINPVAKTLQRKVCALLGDSTTSDIAALANKQQQTFFAAYQAENQGVADSEWMDHPYAYNNDEVTQVLVAYDDGHVVNMATTYYAYMGGAHGLYSTRFTPVDVHTGKEIKLDEVLLPSGKAKLNKLLARQIRLQAKLKPNEPLTEAGLFEDKIEANDNFFVTATGIGFNYTPYEIAPYAAGELQYFISFKDLEKDLQPIFLKKWVAFKNKK
ncbi:MAG: hypothetical protein ABS85_10065 [Sphingobacteriales bacterium SCN 48-20]|uniref:DUF3298 and DUF4163 domain-containing protein n=1 Tax=Terrimonas ferruginea TaxID=249 RepID=UPI00086AA186|nr:DUF3298 and DUF4163 domain-containing protein [Terrimonas ferruginea]MBN8782218.1 DUF3298 domain-containing protein [Terrimonas ferruginea]ODT92251.1 MAG: hypothetical protein ABS85_10065 [Sphingobacteriales bacterium SCN 48-20]OJW42749.1 MAG: hypothetical protein BGO56_11930 [Sphingobacteriales bacterium 48-107]